MKVNWAIRILHFAKPYWGRMLLVFLLSLLATLLGLGYPLFAKFFIDEILLRGRTDLLLPVAAGMFAVTLVAFLSGALNRYLYTWVSARILFDMRVALYRHLQRLSLPFYYKTKLGDIISRMNTDLAEAQRLTTDILLSLLTSLLTLAGAVGLLLWLNWKLFLTTGFLLPVTLLALRRLRPKVAATARELRTKNADLGSFLVETLSGMKLIQSFGVEEYESRRFAQKNEDYVRTILNLQILSVLTSGVPAMFLSISSLVIFLYGGSMVLSGAMSVGALVAFTAYLARALGPAQSLMGLYVNIQRTKVSLERVFELMELEPTVKEKEGAITLPSVKGEVVFDNVSFGYEPETFVLRQASFTLPAGRVTAIIGPSGAGKSTIADLLLRFYDPQEGSIRIDGIDLRDFKLSFLRDTVAVVGQDTILFHATIEENIRYGKPDATWSEIREAARVAYIHDFIESLPDGYHTLVGERGMKLSGGQRQRIAIARAVLRSPQILILDEATSALDWLSEKYVREAVAALMKGRTTVIITHRLASVETADQILVLDGGRIIPSGIHQVRLPGDLSRQLSLAGEGKGPQG